MAKGVRARLDRLRTVIGGSSTQRFGKIDEAYSGDDD
jgi:hypothetical protein